jgi:hypothetical protein
MSRLEEVKAAAAALDPEEQAEFFRWWTQSGTFKARQVAALKRDLFMSAAYVSRSCCQCD